jgi:large subunit ribosomal protein L1
MAKGKKYQAAYAKFDPNANYSLEDAVKLVMETSVTKFDSSIEVHMHLGVDPKQAEQQIRSTVALPHGTGKTVRVVAFVSEDKVKEAKDAGAIEAGNEELIAKIEKGWLEFDKAVATPDMMRNLGKIARILGQAGMMPNPKSGTVSPEIGKTVAEIMKGQVEFRNDKLANLHNVVGKISFGEAKIMENLKVYLKAVKEKKPEKMKGNYVKTLHLATTMGPGIKLDVTGAFAEL